MYVHELSTILEALPPDTYLYLTVGESLFPMRQIEDGPHMQIRQLLQQLYEWPVLGVVIFGDQKDRCHVHALGVSLEHRLELHAVICVLHVEVCNRDTVRFLPRTAGRHTPRIQRRKES